jgi:hypothetical protein
MHAYDRSDKHRILDIIEEIGALPFVACRLLYFELAAYEAQHHFFPTTHRCQHSTMADQGFQLTQDRETRLP